MLCKLCGLEKTDDELVGKDRRPSRVKCKECWAAYVRAKRAENPERMRTYSRTYRKSRPEQTRLTDRKTKNVTRWFNTLVTNARGTARRYDYEFDLDGDFVLSLFERQGGLCYWLGIPLQPALAARDPQRPSLDRLDCNRGYTRDNVVLTSQFANMGRSNATAERMRSFVEQLRDVGLGSTGLRKVA